MEGPWLVKVPNATIKTPTCQLFRAVLDEMSSDDDGIAGIVEVKSIPSLQVRTYG